VERLILPHKMLAVRSHSCRLLLINPLPTIYQTEIASDNPCSQQLAIPAWPDALEVVPLLQLGVFRFGLL
jgi:hypothetical protein